MVHTYPLAPKIKRPQPKQNQTKKHNQKRQGPASYGRSKKPSRATNRNGPGSLQCPRATWNRVGGTTKSPKTFLKLTLKLCPVNSNLKKKQLFDPFKVHPGLQQPKGPWVQELQLSDAAANNTGKGRHAENGERKKGGKNKRISKKLRCASCGDMPWTRWIGPRPGSWK